MITYTKLGTYGRLGNQLFQVAATIAIASDKGVPVRLPENWAYRNYFRVPNDFFGNCVPDTTVHASSFHYDMSYFDHIDFNQCVDLFGYFQSEKYFFNIKEDIKRYLTPNVIKLNEWSVCMHIRRGDYVGNPSHINLTPEYYISAIDKYFSDDRYKFYICTDDVGYARVHFNDDRFVIAERSELEDFELMVSCQNHIIANSSFSWWGAYLADGKQVIRPQKSFCGPLLDLIEDDLWPSEWISHDDRIDLTDSTFIIPFKYDHPDRLENLGIIMDHLNKTYNARILIGEVGGDVIKRSYPDNFIDLNFIHGFHHTRINNHLASLVKTPIVIYTESDIMTPPYQLYSAVKKIRSGYDFVLPFDGTNIKVGKGSNDRDPKLIASIKASGDIGVLSGIEFFGMGDTKQEAFGGTFCANKDTYLKYKGDNEKYISFSPEDYDRAHRFKLLSKFDRIIGPIYHLNHFCGPDSTNKNPFFRNSLKEWEKVRVMNKEELLSYMDTWEWDYTTKVTPNYRSGKNSHVKIDLTDVTWIIPVKYDSFDRQQNLDLCLGWIKKHFYTNIIIGEQGTHEFEYVKDIGCKYIWFNMDAFHRTRMLNLMTVAADTDIVFNHDCDVILCINAVRESVDKLRNGVPFVFPYNGDFMHVPRSYYVDMWASLCAEPFVGLPFNGKTDNSVGGSNGFRRDLWILENENFIGHSPEDRFRAIFAQILFGDLVRADYPLFHIDHFIGPDSSPATNEFIAFNNSETRRCKGLKTKEQVWEYVQSWPWYREHKAAIAAKTKKQL